MTASWKMRSMGGEGGRTRADGRDVAAADEAPLVRGPGREALDAAGRRAVDAVAANPALVHVSGLRGEYRRVQNGVAFLRGETDANAIDPDDVSQGALGDCYLLAAMMTIAQVDPGAIERLIRDNGDGTYDVTIYVIQDGRKTPRVVRVDDQFAFVGRYSEAEYAKIGDNSGQGANRRNEIWPMLIEKAYAVVMGSYDAIQGGGTAQGLEALLPGHVRTLDTRGADPTELGFEIRTALASRRAVMATIGEGLLTTLGVGAAALGASLLRRIGVDVSGPRNADRAGLTDVHAYAVVSVDLAAGTIRLRDPMSSGDDNLVQVSLADFKRFAYRVAISSDPLT
jgi:hypothetical protein